MKDRPYRNLLDWAFGQTGLEPRDQHVLLRLAKLGYSSGEVFASQATIARMTGYSISTVGRSIRRLTDRGLIHEVTVGLRVRATKTYRFSWTMSKSSHKQNDRPPAVNLPLDLGHDDRQNLRVKSKHESRTGGEARPIRNVISKLMNKLWAGS